MSNPPPKPPGQKTKTIKVSYLARVEGEGSLYVKTKGQEVVDVKLKIFEPPRFFEAFLKGRSFQEAPDITARICGICPVAYQMSTVHAIEDAFGLTISEPIRELRRLLYCGEWIESHTLHIIMLHAPDFLKLHDAIGLAKVFKKEVETGLKIKKAGNEIISVLGGREIHPINVKVGGFYSLPDKARFESLIEGLQWAKEGTYDILKWVSQFEFPEVTIDYELVSLVHERDYPFNEGRIQSSKGLNIPVSHYDQHFKEEHVPHSTALHSKHVGHGSYLTGPMARFAQNYQKMGPTILSLIEEFQIDPACTNPYRSIQIRALEVMYAIEEALRILKDYSDETEPSLPVTPKAGVGYATTEAPRGILYHRLDLDEEGNLKSAKIVPPTSQNQKRIEDDLRQVVTECLDFSEEDLTHRLEQTIRNYDPCISCSTHFLNLTLERS